MSFTAADFLALEQISATTAKMDEVLDSIEWKFRERLGGAYHYTKSRSARLSEGWYGYWRDIHGVLYTAGFGGQGPGELPHCFVAVKTWSGITEPTPSNLFQQALRLAWELPTQSLDRIEVSHPLSLFLNPADEVTPLVRMRDWFQSKFAILNETLVLHPQMLHGSSEVVPENDNSELGYIDSDNDAAAI